ncbi:hypothetical protein A8924_2811 [Saccharopolyspora erythraea NRRL 2338]|uniref:Integral membrane protein n=2 Tax=Saccharopolyspora erythraea TaxID=1836 RepID=A4FCD8_SACEN|nr:hypothetical protein [Saccharopolyspora erythraea]EQD83906.1 membrane protein [Saccharopolyspora erythraea D]PFG95477.1 hypothetical protein A8924_2811 [Saccharopolyspora erythraea NRRL 2338]QRK92106.1 hypothetical protein JQX30_12585 [Saccharopolyspora erythraea]CAM01713.1 integral membrane protein [Saccharopolyspora erythraea NRRL 2338]
MAQAAHGARGARPSPAPWTGGMELFAAVMMILIGLFHLAVGLAAILQSSFQVVTDDYIYSFDITSWGWVHLVLGVLIGLVGIALIMGQTWARVVGMILAGLSILGNFLFIPYQPVWSVLVIAIDVAVIWALTLRLRELPESQTR